jgi:agmatinase
MRPEAVPAGHVAVMGAPHDMTLSTRQSTRYAPKVIRQHSCHFITQTRSAPTPEIVDVATGRRVRLPDEPRLVDCGDIVVYPNSLEKTDQALREATRLLVGRGVFPVILGGDHYVSYPLFEGVGKALTEVGRARRLGYLQIDGHLDAMDDNRLWGKHWHGSNARRIAELPFTSVRNVAWLGINGLTWGNEWDFVHENGLRMLTTADIRRIGIREAARQALEAAADGVDAVYVSLDIDVVDVSLSPGAGSVNFGGITPGELLDAVDFLGGHDIISALDVVEVAPALDPSGITARLAATAIMTFLMPRLFEKL